MLNRVIENFWRWSSEGRLPIMVHTNPATYGFAHAREYLTLENQQRFDRLTIVDSIEFVHDHLLGKLKVNHPERSVALHPVVLRRQDGKIFPKARSHRAPVQRRPLVPRPASAAAPSPEIAASCSPS